MDFLKVRFLSSGQSFAELPARSNVAPRAYNLDLLALLISDHFLCVIHPAVGAVLLEKSVLERVGTFLEQMDRFGPSPQKGRRDARGSTRSLDVRGIPAARTQANL